MLGNLYLTGFMGAGKSTVAAILARQLGRTKVDTDPLVEQRLGMTIAQAFERLGEDAFRAAETKVLAGLAKRQRLVVATGGGMPASEGNRELMRSSGRVVHLAADLATCRAHIGPEQAALRPLWQRPGEVERLWASRQAAYADCYLTVEVAGITPDETARRVMEGLLAQKRFSVSLDGVACPVTPSWRAEQEVAALAQGRKVAIITDRNLARLHFERYREALGDVVEVVVPPGEGAKRLVSAGKVYQALLEGGMARDGLVIGLGGGVVTDLAAFIAATYMRGMDFALAATSLVGCVDAAVGGKAAVNLGAHKNLVGLFTRPRLVALDLWGLGTLPRRQVTEGLVEAVKTGLALDPGLFRLIRDHGPALSRGDLPLMAAVARASAQAKAEVVSQDFTEAGGRMVLNLGHTYGHALEGLSGYRLSHGRAVAVGLMVAAAASRGRELITEALYRDALETIRPLAPRSWAWPELDRAWGMMQGDKKNRAGKVKFVLLTGLGRSRVVDDITRDELGRAVDMVRRDGHG